MISILQEEGAPEGLGPEPEPDHDREDEANEGYAPLLVEPRAAINP